MVFLDRQMRDWLRRFSGSRGRVNEHWMDIYRGDPSFRKVRMTVELRLGDRRILAAMVPMTTTSSLDSGLNSRTYNYRPLLLEEAEVETTVEPFRQTAEARSVTLRLSAQALQLELSLAEGATISGLAEVSLQRDGDDHDLRLILLRGEATGGLTWDANRGGSVQIQVSDFRTTQAAKLPEHAVDTARWPSAADSAIGGRYPLIFNGYPKVSALLVFEDAADPLYLYLGSSTQNLSASATYVNGELAAGSYAPATDTSGQDAKGTRVRYIDFSSTAAAWETGDTVYVDVENGGRGWGAVEVLEHLFSRYTAYGAIGLNRDLFGRAQTRMPGAAPKVLINSSGDEGQDVLSFIEGTFLKSFPMLHMTYDGPGLGPVVFSRATGGNGRGLEFRVTGGTFPLLSRESDYAESSRDERYNAFELRYNYNAMDDDYSGIISLNASNSPICALSERYDNGRRVMPALDSQLIHSDAQAAYVIRWLAAHRAVPRYRVTWSTFPSAMLRLRPGMTGSYTDPNRAQFTNSIATIVSTKYARTGSTITFDIWHPKWGNRLLL